MVKVKGCPAGDQWDATAGANIPYQTVRVPHKLPDIILLRGTANVYQMLGNTPL
jgi:hypothetical protein